MDPTTYFKEFLKPNYDELLADRLNKTKLMNAVIPAYHLMDAVSVLSSQSKESIRKLVISQCPQFIYIADAADAYKHDTINKQHRGRTRDITQLIGTMGSEAAFTDCTYFSDGTSWTDSKEAFVIYDDNGHPHDLVCCVRKVVEFWERYLQIG